MDSQLAGARLRWAAGTEDAVTQHNRCWRDSLLPGRVDDLHPPGGGCSVEDRLVQKGLDGLLKRVRTPRMSDFRADAVTGMSPDRPSVQPRPERPAAVGTL